MLSFLSYPTSVSALKALRVCPYLQEMSLSLYTFLHAPPTHQGLLPPPPHFELLCLHLCKGERLQTGSICGPGLYLHVCLWTQRGEATSQ